MVDLSLEPALHDRHRLHLPIFRNQPCTSVRRRGALLLWPKYIINVTGKMGALWPLNRSRVSADRRPTDNQASKKSTSTVLHFLPKAVLAPGPPPRWPAAQKVERPPSTVHSQCGADDEFQGAIGFACARVTTRAYKRLRVATLCFGGLVPIAEHYVANRRC
jgi:hypothetical protein